MDKQFHIPIINILRGIASLSVCLYHFVCTTTGYITHELILESFHYGQKGVQVFFIISGIVIPLSMIKTEYSYSLFSKFILKRFVRIEPPYLVAVILGSAYLVLRNFIPGSAAVDLSPSFKDIILHLGYLVPFFEDTTWINPVFWTLSIEFQYYLFLAFLFPMVVKGKNYVRWGFTLLILGIPFLFEGSAFFPYWAPYFGLGIFYALFRVEKISLEEFISSMLLCGITVILHQGWVDLCIGLATLLVIHFYSKYKNKVGDFLGDISYSLYLLHSIIGSAFVNFMSHRVHSPLGKFVVISLGVAISIFSAYFFWKWIEKPSQRLSKKIKMEKPKPEIHSH